jgi:8-oxo-dGTP diphosphatase
MTKPVLLVVAAALFDDEGRILLAQRPVGKQLAGLWEFPGGKLEPGETPEAALVRELEEELSIRVNESALEPLTFASFAYPTFHLLMPLYGCEKWSGSIQPREGQAFAWVETSRLRDYPAPPADLPLFDWLAQRP